MQITGEKEGGSREKRIVACDRLCTLLMSRDITWVNHLILILFFIAYVE